MRLAKESGADLVSVFFSWILRKVDVSLSLSFSHKQIVHAGDLDYESAPKMWVEFVKETVRDIVEYIAAKGNHDADGWDGVRYLWSGSEGYQKLLEEQQKHLGCIPVIGETPQATHSTDSVLVLMGG